jgi:O-antigen ligase
MLRQTNRLIFNIILAFLVLNLLLPGEVHPLSLVITQAVIFGLAAIQLIFLRPREKPTGWVWLGALFVAALLVSQLASIHRFGSMQTAVQILSMAVLAWLVADIRPGERELRVSGIVLIGAAALLAGIGLLQLVTYFSQAPDPELVKRVLPVSDSYINQIFTQKRIFATFALPTTFSAFLAMILPLGAALGIAHRKDWRILAAIAAGLLLIIAAIVQAKSHGGPVALLAAVVVTLLILLRKRRAVVLWGIIGALVLGAVVLLAVGALRGNFLWDLAAHDSPIRLRWNLWAAGFEMWTHNWLLGIGLGNFHIGFLPFLGPGVLPTKYLHNTYLQLPIELGLLGLVAMIAVVGLLLRRLWREFGKIERNGGIRADPVRIGLLVGVLTFLFVNGIEIVLYFHSLGLLGAFLVGLLMGRRVEGESEETASPALKPSRLRIAVALVFILAMVMLGRWFVADYFYDKAIQKVTQAALEPDAAPLLSGRAGEGEAHEPEALARRTELWQAVVEQASIAAAIESGNHEYHYLLGRAYEGLAAQRKDRNFLIEAQSRFQQAVELCPRLPYLRYSNALVLLRLGNLLNATGEIAEAARLYPSNQDYRAALSALQQRIMMFMGPRIPIGGAAE